MSMDAVKFLAERQRMCKAHDVCENCPLRKMHTGLCYNLCFKHPEEAVVAVEKWAEEHPRKTRQSVFLEQYPEANIGENGVLRVSPCMISASHRNAHGSCATMNRDCADCREEYWMHEVE